jgi:hypothetical protein
MRIAFRQNLQKPGKRRYARERELIVKNARRGRFRQFGCVDAELIVKTRAPLHPEAIAGLKNRPNSTGASALYKAARTPVLACKDVSDHARFAMRPTQQKNAVVSPSHEACPQ